jgi:2-hydroxy-6-oxonona-2,4-dienedioate hydrolase
MRAHFENIGGAMTRYFRAGKGPPLLLLHGVGMTSDSWCRAIEPLARDFDVIAPDLLDNGFTGTGNYAGGPPHPAILDHIEALVDHLGLGRVTLIGSSFGAALSILLYDRRPQAYDALVLVSSGSAFKSPEELVAMYKGAAANGRTAFSDPSLETCRARLANIFYDPARIPRELLLMQLTPLALPTALASFERRMAGMTDLEAMRPFAIGDRLEKISVPVLAIWGRQDPRGDYEGASRVLGALPQVRLEVIDRCGHLPHLEQPDRFIELVQGFLTEALAPKRETPSSSAALKNK